VKNNYVALTGEHVVHSGYDGAERIIGGTRLVPLHAAPDTEVPFRFVPDFPDVPMEEVYARGEAEAPAVVLHGYGSGRAAYVGCDVGSLFWADLQADHARLVGNLVRWALAGSPGVQVDGLGLLDLATWTGPDGIALALVNLTNPMTMRGPFRDVYPVGPLRVSIPVAAEETVASVRLSVANLDVPFTRTASGVVFTVPRLELLEVARVHLAAHPSGSPPQESL
jgi:hypothetical protein